MDYGVRMTSLDIACKRSCKVEHGPALYLQAARDDSSPTQLGKMKFGGFGEMTILISTMG